MVFGHLVEVKHSSLLAPFSSLKPRATHSSSLSGELFTTTVSVVAEVALPNCLTGISLKIDNLFARLFATVLIPPQLCASKL